MTHIRLIVVFNSNILIIEYRYSVDYSIRLIVAALGYILYFYIYFRVKYSSSGKVNSMASEDLCDEILAGYFPHIDDEYSAYIKGTTIVGMYPTEFC